MDGLMNGPMGERNYSSTVDCVHMRILCDYRVDTGEGLLIKKDGSEIQKTYFAVKCKIIVLNMKAFTLTIKPVTNLGETLG